MPRIPETVIDQVRLSTDIVDVVGDHVALTRRGKNFVGLCPFHDDSTPSLNVSQENRSTSVSPAVRAATALHFCAT